MSRSQTDQVIDEEETETCPLCIEEFDLSDRHFYPCQCGYQICFFCYNNIKTTMNGLCPACRRPYDDKPVFHDPSPEEKALEKERLAQQAKRKAAARQKEAQKREADTLSRKHLAGIRVRQKNLVYVTGMKPLISDTQLAELLRTEAYFGQYGKIVKVVVSKAKEAQSQHTIGVYVTFARKEDAARCIQAVDGSENQDTRLRAQYGTTKYCSAYIRNETCTNRSCMFLHEPGEENESFTRQDLSSLNVFSTQSPSQSYATSSTQPSQLQAPPQQAPQSIAAAIQPQDLEQPKEKDNNVESDEINPALPSTASWASKNNIGHKTMLVQNNTTSTSRVPVSAIDVQPAQLLPLDSKHNLSIDENQAESSEETTGEAAQAVNEEYLIPQSPRMHNLLDELRKSVASDKFIFVFDDESIDNRLLELIKKFPALFDPSGGVRRQSFKRQEIERERRENESQVAMQALSSMDIEENAEGGSLQLGGEPEDRHNLDLDQQRHAIQPPTQDNLSSPVPGLDHPFSPVNASLSNQNGRSTLLQQQQQQQYLLQQLNSASPNSLLPTKNSQQSQSNLSHHGGVNLGHTRQTSRFSFANDVSASASVKPVANPKLMNQQSSMMPPQQGGQYGQYSQQQGNKFFTSGVQGPPPGLKATGTPPVSGGGMFGQGHGFATAGLGYSIGSAGRNANDEMFRELMRNRGGSAGSGQASDGGRREFMFPSPFLHNLSENSTPAPALGLSSFQYGLQSGAVQDHGQLKQKKKGKKHRHANTSSSGGGVVDLADPSILQARLQHASNTSSQGLYGNQGHSNGGMNPMIYNNNNGYGRW